MYEYSDAAQLFHHRATKTILAWIYLEEMEERVKNTEQEEINDAVDAP